MMRNFLFLALVLFAKISVAQFSTCVEDLDKEYVGHVTANSTRFITSANYPETNEISYHQIGLCKSGGLTSVSGFAFEGVVTTSDFNYAHGMDLPDSIPSVIRLYSDFGMDLIFKIQHDSLPEKGTISSLACLDDGYVMEINDYSNFRKNLVFTDLNFSVKKIIFDDADGELFVKNNTVFVNNGDEISAYSDQYQKILSIPKPLDQNGNQQTPAIGYTEFIGLQADEQYVYTSISLTRYVYQNGDFVSFHDLELRKYRISDGKLVKKHLFEKADTNYSNHTYIFANHFLQRVGDRLFLCGNAFAQQPTAWSALFLAVTDTALNPIFVCDTLAFDSEKEVDIYGMAVNENEQIALLYNTYSSQSKYHLLEISNYNGTEIADQHPSKITVGPNPFDQQLKISGIESNSASYKLYNQLGQELVAGKLKVGLNELEIDLAPGIYHLTINDQAKYTTVKLIKN